MDSSNVAVFSVCSVCYLPKALVLAESVFRMDNIKTVIYLIDRKGPAVQESQFADIRWIEDEGIPDFYNLAFKYDVTELSTCVKPMLAERLLANHSKVIFLDPDICVYSSLQSLEAELVSHPILLTPHYCTPIDSREENYDLAMMRFGSFNLGFFAVSSDPEARRFLRWWSDRCIALGYFETQFGLSTDQKWVSIAPCFFPNIKILYDPGYNMAFWNLHERALVGTENGYAVNGQSSLIFFHFSSFDEKRPRSVSKRSHAWRESGREDLFKICDDYAAALKRFDQGYSSVEYGFDYLDNGWYVSPTLRRAYAAVESELGLENPFVVDKPILSFIRMNHLRERKNARFRPEGAGDISQHSSKFAMVNKGMRIMLFFIGPNAFSNLARLFVYLSSYRQNKDIWKVPYKQARG